MSGYKRATINISQDEFDRLRDSERKLRSLPQVSPAELQAISRQSEQLIQANANQFERRQAEFEKTIAGMNDYIQRLESATAQAIVSYEANTMAEVQEYAGNLWDHCQRVIDDHSIYFQNAITAAHQQYQGELAQYSRQVREMAGDLTRKQEIAQEWYEAAEQFCIFIENNYNHELLIPGRVERLGRDLDQALENIQAGLSEAVIVATQQLYRSYSDLRIALERLQAERDVLIQSARETIDQILLQAQESQVVPAVDLDGNLLSYQINVDYWVQGRLSDHIENLQIIRDQLADEENLPDNATLQQWLQENLPVCYKTLEDIVLDARINALNSQLRINIADLVIRSLQEQGFALSASEYETDDMRLAYAARLINLEGNEVDVQVVPAGYNIGENELHLQSFDREERTEHELQRRWFEVSKSLSSYGLAVDSYIREDAGAYSSGKPPATRGLDVQPDVKRKTMTKPSG